MTLDFLYFWLTAFTLLVVVGVILEGEEILSEIRAHGWSKSEHKVAKIGFALLVIGLAGELLFQTRIESADAMLKREADKKIADAQRETAQIRERAALTEERLLSERRLTANERWRLERLERVVYLELCHQRCKQKSRRA